MEVTERDFRVKCFDGVYRVFLFPDDLMGVEYTVEGVPMDANGFWSSGDNDVYVESDGAEWIPVGLENVMPRVAAWAYNLGFEKGKECK